MARRRAAQPVIEEDDVFTDVEDDDLELDDEVDELELDDEPEPEPEPAPRRRGRPRKAAAPAPADDDDDEPVEETPAPRKRAAKKAAPAKATKKAATTGSEYTTAWLVKHVSEQVGRDVTGMEVRTVLRRMVREGEYDREIGISSGRYEFRGVNDPTVKKVVRALKNPPARKPRGRKPAAAEAEEVVETPTPRKRVAKKAAPAKAATPARRGRPRKVATSDE